MIRDHIAKRAGLFVVTSAVADPQRFRRGDLNVVDTVAIPDWLKHRIAKSKHNEVLNRLFAQVMVDAVHLMFLECSRNEDVEAASRVQVVSERFFNNNTR